MLTSYYTMPSINYSSKFFESWKFCKIRRITPTIYPTGITLTPR